jgi:hypothetical protein
MRFDHLASSIINLKRVLEPSLHSDSRQIDGEQLTIRVPAAKGPNA